MMSRYFTLRYRQHLTNGMDPEKLRHVKDSFDAVIEIQTKAETLLKTIAKEGPVDPALSARIKCARTLDEIELLVSYLPISIQVITLQR